MICIKFSYKLFEENPLNFDLKMCFPLNSQTGHSRFFSFLLLIYLFTFFSSPMLITDVSLCVFRHFSSWYFFLPFKRWKRFEENRKNFFPLLQMQMFRVVDGKLKKFFRFLEKFSLSLFCFCQLEILIIVFDTETPFPCQLRRSSRNWRKTWRTLWTR